MRTRPRPAGKRCVMPSRISATTPAAVNVKMTSPGMEKHVSVMTAVHVSSTELFTG